VAAAGARAEGASLSALVRAAGGLLFRTGDGGVDVLLVHRPSYDDWSIPKGKALRDESDEDCAVREVEEETGVVAEFAWELPTTRYDDSAGNPKQARYWAMRPAAGDAGPHAEVDDVRWLAPADAIALLSYDRDRAVLRAFGYDGGEPLLLIRHATAGDRDAWRGDDRVRPLDERGLRQAERLPIVLGGHEIRRIFSSPYVRCVKTVEPLAAVRGLRVEARDELAEGTGAAGVLQLAAETGAASAFSLHGDAFDGLIGRVVDKGVTILADLASGGVAEIAELPAPA
jgi:8-oxo-dGTP diphosphatase